MDDIFGRAIWDFIKAGQYEIREKAMFWNMKKPIDWPRSIISDEISSLSAILLNDEYYQFLIGGVEEIDGIQVLNYTHIIPFKAKAWLDLKSRKENGEQVDTKNITKHKNDVFRLSQLITGADAIELTGEIQSDMKTFLLAMIDEDVDLKNLRIRGKKRDILERIANVYGIDF